MLHVNVIRKQFGSVEQSDAQIERMMPALRAFLHERFNLDAKAITTADAIKEALATTFEQSESYWSWHTKAQSKWYDHNALSSINDDELNYVDEDIFPHLSVLYFLQNALCRAFDKTDKLIQGTQLTIEVLKAGTPRWPLPINEEYHRAAALCIRVLADAYEDAMLETERDDGPIGEYFEDMFDADVWLAPDLGEAQAVATPAIIWDLKARPHQIASDVADTWSEHNWKRPIIAANKRKKWVVATYDVLTNRQWVKHIRRGGFESPAFC